MNDRAARSRKPLVLFLVGAGVLVLGAVGVGGWFLLGRAIDEVKTFDAEFFAGLDWGTRPGLAECRVDLPFDEQLLLSRRLEVEGADAVAVGLDVCARLRPVQFTTQTLVDFGDKRLVLEGWPMSAEGPGAMFELLVPVASKLSEAQDRGRPSFGDSAFDGVTTVAWSRVERVTRLTIEHVNGDAFELEVIEGGFELGGQAFVLGQGRQVLRLSSEGELLEVHTVDEVVRPPEGFTEDMMKHARELLDAGR